MNNSKENLLKHKLNINAPSFLPRNIKSSSEFEFNSLFGENFLDDKENNVNLINCSSQFSKPGVQDVIFSETEVIMVDENSLMKILNSNFFNENKKKGEEKSILKNNNDYSENVSKSSDYLECCICLTEITRDKNFGLLSTCHDIFCFDCIKNWHEEKTLTNQEINNKCPICGNEFSKIICSEFYSKDKKLKAKLAKELNKVQTSKKKKKFIKENEEI